VLDPSAEASLDAALNADLAELRASDLDRHLRIVARLHGAVVRTEFGEAVDFRRTIISDSRLIHDSRRLRRLQSTFTAADQAPRG
jgi:hypothetical protein